MTSRRISFLMLATALVPLACRGGDRPPVERVTRVEVRTNDGRTLRVIRDSVRVAQVVAFVNARTERWSRWRTMGGVRIPRVRVDLVDTTATDSARFRGYFGATPNYFATEYDGRVWRSRGASEEDLAEFARLIGVPVESFAAKAPRVSARR